MKKLIQFLKYETQLLFFLKNLTFAKVSKLEETKVREMVQSFRALVAPSGDQGLVPAPTPGDSQLLAASAPLLISAGTGSTHIYTHK